MNATDIANARLAKEALSHIRKTKQASRVPGGEKCLYGGTGCAFSPAIPEKSRKKADALKYGRASDVIYAGLVFDWAKHCCPIFANDLQIQHDKNKDLSGDLFVKAFEAGLQVVCAEHDVEYPE